MSTDHTCDTGNFDRSLCPEPCGLMHSYCDTCGVRQDACAHDDVAKHTDRDAVAAVLAAHLHGMSNPACIRGKWVDAVICDCGWHDAEGAHADHLADVLAPLLAQARAEGRAEVAAKAKKYRREARKHRARAAQAGAEAWDEALTYAWAFNDPAYTILTDTESIHPLLTRNDIEQARQENPYRVIPTGEDGGDRG